MRDVVDHVGEELAERSLANRLMERGMSHAGADDELAVGNGDAVERLDAVDVDEMRRPGEPKRHDWNETLAAGQHAAVVGGKFGKQRDGLVDRFRRVIAECRGLHRAMFIAGLDFGIALSS